MQPESPVIPGQEEMVFAKDQPEYNPLPAIRLEGRQGEVITRWKPRAEELAALAAGASIYLHLWTFGAPLQPILLTVATPEEAARSIGVPHALRYIELVSETVEFKSELPQ
jgi:hypothetical protein